MEGQWHFASDSGLGRTEILANIVLAETRLENILVGMLRITGHIDAGTGKHLSASQFQRQLHSPCQYRPLTAALAELG